MRTAIATVICCNNCQRRHTNSRCHTDNRRRADSASSHATSGSSSRGCTCSGRCGASSTRRCLGPVCCFRGSKCSWRRQHEGHKIAESLCFITFPLFIAWTIRTLEIRIIYFEYNILVKSPFPHTASTIYCGWERRAEGNIRLLTIPLWKYDL